MVEKFHMVFWVCLCYTANMEKLMESLSYLSQHKILAVIVLIVLIAVGYNIWRILRGFLYPPRWRKRSDRKNDLRVQRIKSRRVLHKQLHSLGYTNGIHDSTDIVCVDLENGRQGERVVGGYVFMNKDLLRRNKALIKAGIVKRNAKLRRDVNVPGRKKVAQEAVVIGKDRMSLWHITHGVPYRYLLSDGEIDNMMFMGTAHLNMGARYDRGYVPAQKGTPDSISNRVSYLRQEVERAMKENPRKGLVLEAPRAPGTAGRNRPQFSMDDLERLADFIINSKPKSYFRYGFECFYSEGSVIPDSVEVVMVNLTTGQKVFDILLYNDK